MANEEREKEELGELSEDLLIEHGENYPKSTDYFETGLPVDLKSSTPLADATVALEDRTQSAIVKSVFDTRPVNGTDFHFTDSQSVTVHDETGAIVDFIYSVPPSYVAVLREFKYTINPIFFGLGPNISASISVNGIAQVGHTEMEIPQNYGYFNTHIIAPENAKITLRLIIPLEYADPNPNFSLWAHFHGNLILSKNIPLPFEIGNQLPPRKVPIPPTVNRPRPKPKPKPKPKVKRKKRRVYMSIR